MVQAAALKYGVQASRDFEDNPIFMMLEVKSKSVVIYKSKFIVVIDAQVFSGASRGVYIWLVQLL